MILLVLVVLCSFPLCGMSREEYLSQMGHGMDVDWAKTEKGISSFSERTVRDFVQRGIGHVRIRVVPSDPHEALKLLKPQVALCERYGLYAVVAYRCDGLKEKDNEEELEKAVRWWGIVARGLRDSGPLVSYDLMIEPTDRIAKDKEMLERFVSLALAAVRESDPKRIVMAPAGRLSRSLYLADFPYPDDPYLVAEWHFYAGGIKDWTTGTDEEKAIIDGFATHAVAFTEKTGIPTYVGAIMPRGEGPSESFLSFVLDLLDGHGIPFAINADNHYYVDGCWLDDSLLDILFTAK